jgi:glucuronate isomerase
MQAFVDGAFEKYIKMDRADWPEWLKALSKADDALVQVKNAIRYSQAASTRYNFFAAAG